MKKNVVLFLTSRFSWDGISMCLDNFKQLEKLGYDIITLTTSDLLPDYIYKRSKVVIHDYSEHTCDKKYYYDYYKKTGYGHFFWTSNSHHKAVFFQSTHFPSLLRNTRTLIEVAKAFQYDNYLFIEDDHYIGDEDFYIIRQNFELLNENDLVVYSFDRYANSNEYVYCSYLHFGRCETMQKIVNNFAYTSNEFINSDPDVYLQFYEFTLKELISRYKTDDIKIHNVTELVSNHFKNSRLNLVYSHNDPTDDCRCSILRDVSNNNSVFYYNASLIQKPINLKIFVDKNLISDQTMYPGTWYYIKINDWDVDKIEILIDNRQRKSFRNLNLNNVIYNGELFY